MFIPYDALWARFGARSTLSTGAQIRRSLGLKILQCPEERLSRAHLYTARVHGKREDYYRTTQYSMHRMFDARSKPELNAPLRVGKRVLRAEEEHSNINY